MKNSIRFKLFLMMVLEFFIWGAWLPLIFSYLPSLGFTSSQQSWILNAFPIAAIAGIFFSNQFADRNFAAEKFLAFSHLVGGLAMLGLAFIHSPPEATSFMVQNPNATWNPFAPFWPFCILMFVHCLLYVPTISITNQITFAHIKDSKDFGLVRMGGTLGWILAAWPFTFILVDWAKVHAANPQGIVAWIGTVLGSGLSGEPLQKATVWTYIVAGVASLLLAALSMVLPHTPPKKSGAGGAEKLAWAEAFKLLLHPYVLILWLVTGVDAFVHNCYFNWAGSFLGASAEQGGVGIPGNWIMPVMSVGQVAEILTMLVLGATLKRLGYRATMIIGILAYPVRFAVWSFFPHSQALIILVQILHGICYAFFFVSVYIFAEEYFPKDVRASAQGLFNVMILGIGVLAANTLCPTLAQHTFMKPDGSGTNFHSMFLVPLIIAAVSAVALALFFHPPPQKPAESPAKA